MTSEILHVSHRGSKCLTPKNGRRDWPREVLFEHQFLVTLGQSVQGTRQHPLDKRKPPVQSSPTDTEVLLAERDARTERILAMDANFLCSGTLTAAVAKVEPHILAIALQRLPREDRIRLLQESLIEEMEGGGE